jgi:hypothetical protein
MQQFAAVRTREIYRSPNGDRWLLARDPDIGRVFVRHEPNLPSGGQVADIEIGAFLITAGNGPERQELLRLIGSLEVAYQAAFSTFPRLLDDCTTSFVRSTTG